MKHYSQHREHGYVLLSLLLFLALLSISFTVMIQRIDLQVKRDREEELIHRGVQYSRAVRRFIKTFGRYPSGIEELESTNNIRFLRKRYKDPITGKDFKILHLMDLPTFSSPTAGISVKSMTSQQSDSSRAINAIGADASANASENSDPQVSQSNEQNVVGSPNQTRLNGPDAGVHPQLALPVIPSGIPQKLGEGPMIGVASISKKETIREFDRQNHYNEWHFVYDPSTDQGGLISTPSQRALHRGAGIDNGQSNQSSLSLGATSVHRNSDNGAQLESSTSQ